jgi:transglutaminase-like putative cysteine protease
MIRAALTLALVLAAMAPPVPQDGQQAVSPEFQKYGDSRTFAVIYTGQVKDIPAGTRKIRVWIPVPQESGVQKIRDLNFSREMSFANESKYGNRIAYAEIESPGSAVEITMKFVCTRNEIKSDLEKLAGDGTDPADSFKVFRGPDSLVIVDDEMKKLSDDITKGRKDTVEKARAIYEYVLEKMTYDKSGQGWGMGSTRYACDVGKGNCTDFHALFNSLCRAQGIASGFEIGLYLPYEKGNQEPPGGYHCWAFFRVPGKSWVPVDASEADRFPDRAKYFFGGHTSNRVTLSTGRDITLSPKQDGAPLNYFLNPYAEADGKPVKCDKTWSYKDME